MPNQKIIINFEEKTIKRSLQFKTNAGHVMQIEIVTDIGYGVAKINYTGHMHYPLISENFAPK